MATDAPYKCWSCGVEISADTAMINVGECQKCKLKRRKETYGVPTS